VRSPQHSLPPCHPIARVSAHSRAVLPSHDTFFTVDEDDGMACVEFFSEDDGQLQWVCV